ncbi:MAG TPA: DUF1214 domain-containing protein [Burkholderiaceae bacterium]|nr:DUF1214 domain-containing protein [Burkholderiaceae bacterium]
MARWRRLGIAAALYLTAVGVGLGSAWWVLRHAPAGAHQLTVGAWTGSTLAGSPDADLYTRARVALEGLLALGRDETMYYVARTDDRGRALRSQCAYRIEGAPPAARWWSITAYADDLFLFDAPNRQYSLNGRTARLDANGRFVMSTGPLPQPGLHWLPTPGRRGLVLTLRLYQPSAELQAAPAKLAAPSIQPIGECAP